MNGWLEDLFHTLLTFKHQPDFIRAITAFTERLEFEYFAYGVCVSVHVTQPKYHLLNNYPKNWQVLYGDNDYLGIDPTVQHCLKSTTPIVWHDSLFTHARDFWEDAHAHGIRWGWAQSLQVNRFTKGMLTLSRSHDKLTPVELAQKTHNMVWLNQTAQAGFQKILLPNPQPAIQVPLTPRQKEILKWCAEGKTSYEIGVILSISERTVNFHMANALEKLDVTNKTAAVLRAFQLDCI
ncbi:autoinducer binding domain-containing protein [Oceanicoccus sp. KOV_DT_Chl]|uniref:autoinducer binding domain-containing protein n=1 Tax=Oceanicoccus sp. KOV_DT_Chl TaxID=1904639 RepID=UPI000C7CB419|nr:autoinducer binding domain-containing protein [Oceanicoccus sp. KOV_DT_Chl]